MKKILTSSITDSAQLPLLKRTIDHLQEQELENIKSCVYASLGSSSDSVPIILWGCVGTLSTVTVSNDTLTVTEGAFIYNGEIYQISAQSVTKTGSNVFALSLDTTTFQAGEPTIYSDGVTSVNTNQNLKIKLSQGLTGTGICDWDNRLFANSEYTQTSASGDICDITIAGSTGTVSSVSLYACKNGDMVTLSGYIAITSTGSFNVMTLTLNQRYYQKLGNTLFQVRPVSAYTGTSTYLSVFGSNGNQGSEDKTIIQFTNNTTVTTGIVARYLFNLTYKAENLL